MGPAMTGGRWRTPGKDVGVVVGRLPGEDAPLLGGAGVDEVAQHLCPPLGRALDHAHGGRVGGGLDPQDGGCAHGAPHTRLGL